MIKLTDFLMDSDVGAPLLPELVKLKIKTTYCICDDKEISICKQNLTGIIDYVVLTGGHHFDGDYTKLNSLIGKYLKI